MKDYTQEELIGIENFYFKEAYKLMIRNLIMNKYFTIVKNKDEIEQGIQNVMLKMHLFEMAQPEISLEDVKFRNNKKGIELYFNRFPSYYNPLEEKWYNKYEDGKSESYTMIFQNIMED